MTHPDELVTSAGGSSCRIAARSLGIVSASVARGQRPTQEMIAGHRKATGHRVLSKFVYVLLASCVSYML